MVTEETIKSTERTLTEAKQLMGKVQGQNEDWPGVGAFQKDITEASTLLSQMQQSLSNIFVEFMRDQNEHPDSDREMIVSQDFSKAYSLISKLYNAVNQVHLFLDKGLSQKDALIETEKYLKQLLNHSVIARDHLNEVGHDCAHLKLKGGDLSQK
ncbi:MAG: hypothetical protein J7K40_11210 [candidate division Zixibacteria bacterium]|nr:hypothetical protein [candidate division Zixibacteria bacterium]